MINNNTYYDDILVRFLSYIYEETLPPAVEVTGVRPPQLRVIFFRRKNEKRADRQEFISIRSFYPKTIIQIISTGKTKEILPAGQVIQPVINKHEV